MEIRNLRWSEGGNIVLVVPMGEEAVRSEQNTIAPTTNMERKGFRYSSPRAIAEIIAPNGLRVGSLELDKVDQEIELLKGQPSTCELGRVTMRLDSSNLIQGSPFTASPCRLMCVPTIAGGSPRDWTYTVYARFDGSNLTAEILSMSTSLRNKNFVRPSSQLGDEEELVVRMPSETLKLLMTTGAPATSANLLGRFHLRDTR